MPPPHRLQIEIRGSESDPWTIYPGEETVANATSSSSTNEDANTEPEEPTLLATVDAADAETNSSSSANELAITSLMDPLGGPILSPARDYTAQNWSSSTAWSPSYGLPWSNDQAAFAGSDRLSPLPQQLSFSPRMGNGISPFGYADPTVGMDGYWPFESSLDGFNGPVEYESPFGPEYLFESQSFVQSPPATSLNPRLNIYSQNWFAGTDDNWSSLLNIQSRASPKALLTLLLQQATRSLPATPMTGDGGGLPHPDAVLDTLLSLLPGNLSCESFAYGDKIATKNSDGSVFHEAFYRALFYSIANGFAGLRNIPPGDILQMLRQDGMSSRLTEWIKSNPGIQAKCLADNLFRAAVEACDEVAVELVFQATVNTPSAINPNEIVCKLAGLRYTPIELAAKFRHLGIVNILLGAKVDVNKTYRTVNSDFRDEGALDLAVRKYGNFEPVDVNLVRNLLQHGAKVRADLIDASIRWGQVDVIDELVSHFPTTSHCEYFERRRGSEWLTEIAKHLKNEHATRLIKRIFDHCSNGTCNCPADHQKSLEETLRQATRRGNTELVKFLLPHTKRPVGLAGAVRSGSRELIDLLFSRGATVGEEASSLVALTVGGTTFKNLTTPLAEAIRSQDKNLVKEFESLGAISNMDETHFQAAITSAVEINDCNYLRRLFKRAPACSNWPSRAYLPLLMAIHNDNIEAFFLLLDNGADVNHMGNGPSDNYSQCLVEALRRQNREFVDAILEADFAFEGQNEAMHLAALWNDMSVIEQMVAVGANVDDFISGAVKARNRALVDFLVKLGAPPRVRFKSGETHLQKAAANHGGQMISLLVSYGADPADEGAFLSAIDKDQNVFHKILEAFYERYPNGKPGFGGSVLIKAIEKNDTTLLNSLLEKGFDAKSFSQRDVSKEVCDMTALGFAIMHKKSAEDSISVVQRLIHYSDINGIVSRNRYWKGRRIQGKTALILAVETRSEDMVKLFLNKGANIHQPARSGLKRTPLQRACEIGSFKMVKLLLDYGAKVNEKPAYRGGATALQLASKSGSIKIAELLLSQGAFVHESPGKGGGYTAFEAAAENGCLEMMKFLWNYKPGDADGFTSEKLERAKQFAISGNQRGCAEFIDTLLLPTSSLFLEAGNSLGFM